MPPELRYYLLPPAASPWRRSVAQAAFWSACASAVAILFSIAISQILLGVAIACMLVARQPIRRPRPWLPMMLFLLGTIISLLASGDPHAGLPQIRKMFVYTTLLVIYSLIRKVPVARNLYLAWAIAAGIESVIGIAQFLHKWQTAQALHYGFYIYYLNARITGTMGHWMTFSGEQMLVLIIILAFLLFAKLPRPAYVAACLIAVCTIGLALLLSDTRATWIAMLVALLYLMWSRKKALVLLVPAAALFIYFIGPALLRERVMSIIHPTENLDSNGFRLIVWRTGLRIIAAHPLLGLGPEIVHRDVYNWMPPDTKRPLPPGYYGHLHSIYIHYAAERGIPTMLMLVWMLGMIVFDCVRALKRLPRGRSDTRFLLHAGIACVLAILVEGVAELNLGDSEVLTMFLVLTACSYVAVDAARENPPQEGPEVVATAA